MPGPLGTAKQQSPHLPLPQRDSLELGSLASSSASSPRDSASSPSGAPSSRKLSFDDDPLQTPRPNGTRHPMRSLSVTSAFDFAPPIFSLSSTNGYTSIGGPATLDPTVAADGGSLERNKSLTYLNGLSLVVGLIIGSGIFSSPSSVNRNAGSPGAALIIWVVAGLLAWTGASSYAELGGAIPLNGGGQVYLAKTYGDMAGFLFSWCHVCVLRPGSSAIISIIFGEYTVRAFIGPNASDASPYINKGVAIGGLLAVTFLNSLSTKIAVRAADLFMFMKFIALLGVTITGVVVAVTGFSWSGNPNTDWKTHGWFEGTSYDVSTWAVALYAGLWAYDGWDNVNYVTGELVHPMRDLPRVVHSALPLVIVCYILANISYFLVLPLDVTSTSQTIAVAYGSQVLGTLGALILALTVAGSCFGALNANMFTASRLFYAAAKEGYMPAVIGTLGFRGKSAINLATRSRLSKPEGFFGRTFSRICSYETRSTLFLTPVAALLVNLALATFYVILGTFETLVIFCGVTSYVLYFAVVLGLLVLRVREPNLERPYRCWLSTPVIFCCVSLFLVSRTVVTSPWTSLAVVVYIVAGVAVYMGKMGRDAFQQGIRAGNGDWRFWKRWGRN